MRLQIKEFALFCNVSVRALHLYDKMGLFYPSYTDPHNNYRYYDTEQMLEFNTIISLKKVGFSLKEIKEMREHLLSKEEVILKLREKQSENERVINVAAYNIENIKQMLEGLDGLADDENPELEALKVSKMTCLENDKLEHDFSQIIWL